MEENRWEGEMGGTERMRGRDGWKRMDGRQRRLEENGREGERLEDRGWEGEMSGK